MSETDTGKVQRELRLRVDDLQNRLTRLETGIFRAALTVACVTLLLGYLLPFLSATDPDADEESISLLTAVFALADAGGGPFSDEALMASVAVGVLAVATIVTLITLALLFRVDAGERNLKVAKRLSGMLLACCAGGWLLVLALAGHTDGDTSAFSPAMLSFTIGAALGTVLDKLIPERLDS